MTFIKAAVNDRRRIVALGRGERMAAFQQAALGRRCNATRWRPTVRQGAGSHAAETCTPGPPRVRLYRWVIALTGCFVNHYHVSFLHATRLKTTVTCLPYTAFISSTLRVNCSMHGLGLSMRLTQETKVNSWQAYGTLCVCVYLTWSWNGTRLWQTPRQNYHS